MSSKGDYSAAWFESASEADMPRMIDALYRVQKLSAVVRDYQAVLDAIMVESQLIANAEASSLLLFDEDKEELYFSVALGDSSEGNRRLKEVRLRLDQGIAGESARLRQTINVRDASSDSRLHREADETTGFTTRSLLAVPMVDKEHLVGVLEVVNKIGEDGFSTFDERIMEMFASLGASIIVQAKLIEENLQAERMAAIGQTVSGLSHYSKNLLGSVGASIELIDEGFEQDDTASIRGPWRIMKRSIARISNIIEDMLAYSKERNPLLEECSLVDLIDDALASLEPMISKQSIRIEKKVQVETVCTLDARGIHRCLLNLLVNAMDAVEANGEGWICISAWTGDDAALHITVEDNGAGIDTAVLEKIFDPFFSTKGARGTGLGLAVTRKVIEEHGGKIVANNRDSGGGMFEITIAQSL